MSFTVLWNFSCEDKKKNYEHDFAAFESFRRKTCFFIEKCTDFINCLLHPLKHERFALYRKCWQKYFFIPGLVNVVITTIERRYHLSSSETGIIASSYDIASLICLLPVSYFGGRKHRSRWLASGIAVVGVGGLLFSLPHYLSGFYEASLSSSNLCSSGTATTESNCARSLSRFRYFFIFGQLLHGAGSAPLWTLGVSFIGENILLLSKKYVPFRCSYKARL